MKVSELKENDFFETTGHVKFKIIVSQKRIRNKTIGIKEIVRIDTGEVFSEKSFENMIIQKTQVVI